MAVSWADIIQIKDLVNVFSIGGAGFCHQAICLDLRRYAVWYPSAGAAETERCICEA